MEQHCKCLKLVLIMHEILCTDQPLQIKMGMRAACTWWSCVATQHVSVSGQFLEAADAAGLVQQAVHANTVVRLH